MKTLKNFTIFNPQIVQIATRNSRSRPGIKFFQISFSTYEVREPVTLNFKDFECVAQNEIMKT